MPTGWKEEFAVTQKKFLDTLPIRASYSPAHMNYMDPELRRLLAKAKEEGRTLKSITDEAGVGYFKVYNWVSGRSPVIELTVAEKIYQVLTGKGFVKS